jgi:hypothetical protein
VVAVDSWVGKLLSKLDARGAAENTLVIFTGDHGEMLGAHSMQGKGNFFEEAVRVPMIMSFPGEIKKESVVDQPVGHIDLFATILDYLGASKHDNSDGKSLRRFIEGTSTNEEFDERVVVAEYDNRSPVSNIKFDKDLGTNPNFMIRKGRYKLMMPKSWMQAKSLDMMYDLDIDAHELKVSWRRLVMPIIVSVLMPFFVPQNLLQSDPSDREIGKAEHLRILLIEWMLRNNGGSMHYYTDPKWNGQGLGDVNEIRLRRTWKELNYWQSDYWLSFSEPVEIKKGVFRQNEFLYIGRSAPGVLFISAISVQGLDANYFSVDVTSANISQGDHIRVKVKFRSSKWVAVNSLQAYIEIRNDENQISRVEFGIGSVVDVFDDVEGPSDAPIVQHAGSESPTAS